MIAAGQYVWRNLRRQRTRTLMGGLGIFVTVALLTATQLGLDSVSSSYTDLAALRAGRADLIIQAAGSSWFQPKTFTPAQVERKLAGNPHLLGLSPRWTGVIRVEHAGQECYALLLGLNSARERQLQLSGLAPEPDLGPGRCALSQSLAKRLKTEPGASLALRSVAGGPEVVLRLRTVLERQLVLPQEVRDFVAVDEAAARALLGEEESVHTLAGVLREPSQYYDARNLHQSVLRLKTAGAAIAADLGMDYEVRLPKASAIAAFENFSSPLQAIFGVFALLALSVTGLLIYSILSVAVEERIREHAILRTVGARKGYLFSLVLLESSVLSLAGVVPGVLAGVGAAHLLVRVIELALHAPGGAITLAVRPATLWLTAAAGVVVALASGLLPAWHSTRWRIVDALDPFRRGQISSGRSPEATTHRSLLATGAVLSALSMVVFFVLPSAFLSGSPSLIGAVVLGMLLVILLGFTLLAVGALSWTTRLAMLAIGWALGPAAELAAKNLARNRRRNTTTALMFILSVALVIFVASLVVLFSHTAMTMVEQTVGADLRLESEAGGGLKADLAQVPEVTAVTEVRFLRSRTQTGIANDVVLSDLVGLKNLWVVPFGVDADFTNALYAARIQYQQGGSEGFRKLALAASRPLAEGPDQEWPVILSLSAARFLDVAVGDRVELSFRLGSARADGRFRVEAVCATVPGFDSFRSRVANAVGSGVFIPSNVFSRLSAAADREALLARYFVRVRPATSAHEAVAKRIRDDFDIRYRFGVKSTLEQQREARAIYWGTQVFFGLLLAVAVVIAVFALIASMATAVLERRWETGVLKALGLRRAGLFRMFLGEAVGLTLAAGGSGGVVGFALAYLFVLEAATLAEMPVVFTLPYVTFVATFLICLVAGATAAYVPTRRLLRQSAGEILRLQI